MALTATIQRFVVELSDVDRGVYESLEFQAAQHPSESDLYLVTRVLAYLLEYRDRIEFGRGISDPEEPAIFVDDMTGIKELWIEIGQPSAERLHKVTKAAKDVCVYCHKGPDSTREHLASGNVHRADEVKVVSFEQSFLNTLADSLTRKNTWNVLVSDDELYVTVGDETLQTTPVIG